MAGGDEDDVAKAAEIVAAYLTSNPMPPDEIPALIEKVHATLLRVRHADALAKLPAVNPEQSVTETLVTCLECGRTMRFLRRHLKAAHGLSPHAYRLRWSLPANHALIAPDYSNRRAAIAREIGLGSHEMKKKTAKKEG